MVSKDLNNMIRAKTLFIIIDRNSLINVTLYKAKDKFFLHMQILFRFFVLHIYGENMMDQIIKKDSNIKHLANLFN